MQASLPWQQRVIGSPQRSQRYLLAKLNLFPDNDIAPIAIQTLDYDVAGNTDVEIGLGEFKSELKHNNIIREHVKFALGFKHGQTRTECKAVVNGSLSSTAWISQGAGG